MQAGARRAAVDELAAVLGEALNRTRYRSVVLTAGPGTGKTHTLRQLTTGATVPIRWATGDELSWRQPYGVATALLGVELPTPVPADADELLLAALDEQCAAGPLLLVVDDAHQCDAASLNLLGRIADAGRDLPVVLLVARRQLPAREQLTRLVARSEVREFTLPPMDAMDLDVVVHDRTGRWPGPGLRTVLSRTGGNPLLAAAVLDALTAAGNVVGNGDTIDTDPVRAHVPADLDAAMNSQLASLTGPPRDVIRRLAVWGSAASITELSALAGQRPAALVEAVQQAVDAGIVSLDEDGMIRFVHDAYAEAAYRAIPPPLRRVLHAAAADCRTDSNRTARARDRLAAGGTDALAQALADSGGELANVPTVAADVLGHVQTTSSDVASLAAARANALAMSGQLSTARDVARSGLQTAADPDTIAALRQMLFFTATASGDIDDVLAQVRRLLDGGAPPQARHALLEYLNYLKILGGVEPLPLQAISEGEGSTTATGLTAEAIRCTLVGSAHAGVEYALEAARRHRPGTGPTDGASAGIWPPWAELFNDGPAAAAALLRRLDDESAQPAVGWQRAYRHFIAAAVDLAAFRLGDAAAHFDAGFDLAATAEMGWTSMAVCGRTLIDVHRGDVTAAARRLDDWERRGEREQFGLPASRRARVAVLEAQRRFSEAAVLAAAVWQYAIDNHFYGWLPTVAPEFARVALRAADPGLLLAVRAGLDLVPRPLTPAAGAPTVLVEALTLPDTVDIAEAATGAADAAAAIGDGIVEAIAVEEAACIAAVSGDKLAARALARRLFELTAAAGADGVSARALSRLRTAGVRFGSAATRRRPRSGWPSLTPTERRITVLVAEGASGPDIARSLHIAPRTVQTHVSNVLAKLGLQTRLELAAAAREHLPQER